MNQNNKNNDLKKEKEIQITDINKDIQLQNFDKENSNLKTKELKTANSQGDKIKQDELETEQTLYEKHKDHKTDDKYINTKKESSNIDLKVQNIEKNNYEAEVLKEKTSKTTSIHNTKNKTFNLFKLLFLGKYLIYTLIGIAIFTLISTIGIGFKMGSFSFKKGGETSIIAASKGYKKIDTLFTSFAYVPIIEFKTKKVSASTLNSMKLWGTKETVDVTIGYCVRRYDVGIGYENVTKLIKENKDAICKGDFNAIPEPKILTTASNSSQIFGDYMEADCDLLDKKGITQKESKSTTIIKSKLDNSSWKTISQNSKNILVGFSKIYCDENNNQIISEINQNSGVNNEK